MKYRECPASSSPLIVRNVTEMVFSESPYAWNARWRRFCNNGSDWSILSSGYKYAAQWPINIVIHNDPNANTVDYTWSDATISNGLTSTYNSSFYTEQGLDVYIAGEGVYEHFIITSIDINYQYTVPPTPATRPPTTGNPTSSIPTASPLLQPPTTSPTEPAPTSSPSKSPTNKPITKVPTMDLVIPTETMSPLKSPHNYTNSVVAVSGVTKLEFSSADHWEYVIVGSAMWCVGVVCGFMLVVIFKKRQHRGSFSPIVPEIAMNGHQAVVNADVSLYFGSAHQSIWQRFNIQILNLHWFGDQIVVVRS